MEVQYHIHKGSPLIPNLTRINPIPRIDIYFSFLKIYSNIIPHKQDFPLGLSVNILKPRIPYFVHSTFSVHLNLLDLIILTMYIRWTVQIMKLLIVETSPIPILIPLGTKYSNQDPVFKNP